MPKDTGKASGALANVLASRWGLLCSEFCLLRFEVSERQVMDPEFLSEGCSEWP